MLTRRTAVLIGWAAAAAAAFLLAFVLAGRGAEPTAATAVGRPVVTLPATDERPGVARLGRAPALPRLRTVRETGVPGAVAPTGAAQPTVTASPSPGSSTSQSPVVPQATAPPSSGQGQLQQQPERRPEQRPPAIVEDSG